jgi:uncharacterized protein DUF4325
MAFWFGLREFGQTFATRGRGAELRDAVITRCAGEEKVVIDFAEVTHVSYSFADEFVGKLSADHPESPAIELINMIDTVDHTVRSAQQRRIGAITC